MKYEKKYEVDRIASRDDGRYAINMVLLDKTNPNKPVLVATNGRSLAAVPVTETETDDAGLVPVDALQHARKGRKTGTDSVATVDCNGSVVVHRENGKSEFSRENTRADFPDWRAVVPKHPDVPTHTVNLNGEYLADLLKALGTHRSRTNGYHVRLTFYDELSPIRVDSLDPDSAGAFGLLMPITVD